MNLVAAVDINWAIGLNGDLLEHIPDDLKNFKSLTLGKVVVMGRKTLESLPNGKPLKDRENIVLTNNRELSLENVTICHSLEELFSKLKKYNTDDIFVIGGQEIYNQLYKYCTNAYITKIFKAYEADKFMSDLDSLDNWSIISESSQFDYKGLKYKYIHYINSSPYKF